MKQKQNIKIEIKNTFIQSQSGEKLQPINQKSLGQIINQLSNVSEDNAGSKFQIDQNNKNDDSNKGGNAKLLDMVQLTTDPDGPFIHKLNQEALQNLLGKDEIDEYTFEQAQKE